MVLMKRIPFLLALVAIFTMSSLTALAQIQQVGHETTFDVATWNIKWFGAPSNGPNDDARQVRNVRDIVQGSGIELWAVQEIADANRFLELLSELGPDWSGELATHSGTQKIGYIWDTRFVRKRSSTHILESFSSDFAGRPPLRAEFEVTLADTTMIVTLINVHMKAFGDASSYQRRVNASVRLKNHIDFSALASASVIFLGDYNDELLQSTYAGRTSPYDNFLSDTPNYAAITLALEQNNEFTWIGSSNGSNLDHIIISNELSASYVPGSASTMQGLNSLLGFTAQTSDHLPVYASFASSTVLDVEEETLPFRFEVSALYPNPARNVTSISVSVPHTTLIRVHMVDILGRVVAQSEYLRAVGNHTLELAWENLIPGAYFVRVSNAAHGRTLPLAIVR